MTQQLTDDEKDKQQAMLRDLMGGKKLVIGAGDDATGRLVFGEEWSRIKAGMEPDSQYEVDFAALPPPDPAHDLAAVVISGSNISFFCTCGATLSPKAGQRWDVTDNKDGTVKLHPSVDIEGHFHAYYDRVPWAATMSAAIEIARTRREALPAPASKG